MTTKIIGLAAIALASALISTGASAHVAGGALVSGNGKGISSSFTKCIVVADGSKVDCGAAKPAKKKPVAQKITLAGDALFDTNSAEIKAEGQPALDEFAARTKLVDITEIDIVGHADSRGSDEHNLELSARRAVAVRDYLVSKKVSPHGIVTSGAGESQPVASNDTAEGRAKNRRVDITLTGSKK